MTTSRTQTPPALRGLKNEAGQSALEIVGAMAVLVVVLAIVFFVYGRVSDGGTDSASQVAGAPTSRAAESPTHAALVEADTPSPATGDPPTIPVRAATPPPAVPPTIGPATQRQLLAASLLDTSDLGGSWQRTVVDGAQISDTYYCNPNDRFAPPQIGAVFNDATRRHLLLTEGVSILPDGGAADLFRRLRAATAGCGTLHTSDGGQQIVLTVAPRSFAVYGDDTFALGIATRVQGASENSEGVALLIRRGDLVLALLDLVPGALDVSATESIARSADVKLAQLQNQLH